MADEEGHVGEQGYSLSPIAVKQLPPQRPRTKRYVVAAGCELCGSYRGKLRAGTEVFARDFPGGDGQLAALVEAGSLVVVER